MRPNARTLTLLAAALLLARSATAFTYWNDVRHSAELPGGLVTVRLENPSGTGVINELLYADGGVQSVTMEPVADGPSTVQASVPAPGAGARFYGFRLVQGTDLELLSVRLADGVSPGLSDLAPLSTDPTGDEVFGLEHLDLIGCRVGRDGERLHAALTNAGSGFPVNSGFTFFSYLLGITNPSVADPETVFAMIHTVDVSGIIEPGLYQVNGTGVNDLVKIGEITVSELPDQDTLLLSCSLADLEANPLFQSWYDPTDPRISVAGFSQRVTILGGAEEADRTGGGVWHLRDVALGPLSSELPQLGALIIPEPGEGGVVSTEYSDAGGHCPVISELEIDGVVFPLRPQSLDYDEPVNYASAPALPPVENGTWTSIIARVSDNQSDLVEVEEMVVGVSEARSGLQLRAAPNPFTGVTEFGFSLPRAGSVELAVFDLSGRRVATLLRGDLPAGRHGRTWNGRDDAGRPQPSGVYVYGLRTAGQLMVQRVTMVR